MSLIYDNWERLVAAVLKREEFWAMCHAPPSPTISSISSDFGSNSIFLLDEDSKSAKSDGQESSSQIVEEWTEQYEPGLHITLVSTIDGTIELKRIRFSRTRFNEVEAKAWWHDNREEVCQKYDILGKSEESSRSSEEPDEPISPVGNGHPLWGTASHIVDQRVVEYEPGIYVTIGDFGDVLRIRFDRIRFNTKHQAEAWWLQNHEQVCDTALALALY